MPKTIGINPEVRDVLIRGTWPSEEVFKLPDGQLDRKLYEGVNKVLTALGGKWDRKVAGHRFSAGARAALEGALSAGSVVDKKKTLEQFFTPEAVADRLIQAAEVADGLDVLEPSAGAGALIHAVRRVAPAANITAAEIDPELEAGLLALNVAEVVIGDFATLDIGRFDRVVMNPPFSNGADMAHVTRAFEMLRSGGVLAAIMSPHWTFASSARAQTFRDFAEANRGLWTPLPEGSFKESGTGVGTGILVLKKA